MLSCLGESSPAVRKSDAAATYFRLGTSASINGQPPPSAIFTTASSFLIYAGVGAIAALKPAATQRHSGFVPLVERPQIFLLRASQRAEFVNGSDYVTGGRPDFNWEATAADLRRVRGWFRISFGIFDGKQ